MNCGICGRRVLKDVMIDDVMTCYKCRITWLKAWNKANNMKSKIN